MDLENLLLGEEDLPEKWTVESKREVELKKEIAKLNPLRSVAATYRLPTVVKKVGFVRTALYKFESNESAKNAVGSIIEVTKREVLLRIPYPFKLGKPTERKEIIGDYIAQGVYWKLPPPFKPCALAILKGDLIIIGAGPNLENVIKLLETLIENIEKNLVSNLKEVESRTGKSTD